MLVIVSLLTDSALVFFSEDSKKKKKKKPPYPSYEPMHTYLLKAEAVFPCFILIESDKNNTKNSR